VEDRGPLSPTRRLKAKDEEDFLKLQRAANEEVDDAVQFAESSPLEPVEQLTRFVYAEPAA
jgi:TPP-dependent pyruvate/acetoin dehydrogenase alpha subunit